MIPTPRTFAPTPAITAVLSSNPLACIFLPVVTIPTKVAFEIDVTPTNPVLGNVSIGLSKSFGDSSVFSSRVGLSSVMILGL